MMSLPTVHPKGTRARILLSSVFGPYAQNDDYPKLRSVDTRLLVKTLQSNGIRVLGSSIIGLEHHSPENIDRIIDYAIPHETDFYKNSWRSTNSPLHDRADRKGSVNGRCASRCIPNRDM